LPWLGIYLGAVTLPLLALLLGPAQAGRGFHWDLAMALGYAGLAMLVVQFVLTARVRRVTAPFGIDLIYYFHRYLAVLGLLVILFHYGILKVSNPHAMGPLDWRFAPPHMTAGRSALLLFLTAVLLSLLRRQLRLEYDRWRLTHALLTTAGVALALSHVLGSGQYLDNVWKQSLWACYGIAWAGLIGYVRAWRPWRLVRYPWRITDVRAEGGRVWTLVLSPPSGQPQEFAPGQFGWLSARSSPFAMREHPFSIASSAVRSDRIELSIKEVGDFTAGVRDLRPGEVVWFDAPYGAFTIDRHFNPDGYVFVAGGIGIAPIMSMLRTLRDRHDCRPLLLFYGNRVRDRIAFREELDRLVRDLELKVVHVLIEPPADWRGERGFVTREILSRHMEAAVLQRDFFICGPKPMSREVERSLHSLGVPAERVHAEIFDWV
jgi:predicted ferric reductase